MNGMKKVLLGLSGLITLAAVVIAVLAIINQPHTIFDHDSVLDPTAKPGGAIGSSKGEKRKEEDTPTQTRAQYMVDTEKRKEEDTPTQTRVQYMVDTDDPELNEYIRCGAAAVTNTKEAIRTSLCHDGVPVGSRTAVEDTTDTTDWDAVVSHATGDEISVTGFNGEKKARVSKRMLFHVKKCLSTSITTKKTAAEAKFCLQEAALTYPDVRELVDSVKSCVSPSITTLADAAKSMICMSGEEGEPMDEQELSTIEDPETSAFLSRIKKCSQAMSSNPSFANFDALDFIECASGDTFY
jgi:hypothetical protein